MIRLLAAMAALLGLWLPSSIVLGAQAPPGPSVVYRSTFETVAPAVPFDLIMTVNELAPGGWSPPHTHSATAFITILEGEWTNIRIVEGQKTEPVTYRAGDTIVGPAWDVHEAGNLGAVRARFLITRLQPKDAPGTIDLPIESFRPGAPPSRTVYQARAEVTNISGPIDVYQSWAEFLPGARIAAHFHPGLELVIVTEGELTLTKATVTTVGAGDSFVNAVGEIHAGANATTAKASLVTTHLIAAGKPLIFAAE